MWLEWKEKHNGKAMEDLEQGNGLWGEGGGRESKKAIWEVSAVAQRGDHGGMH